MTGRIVWDSGCNKRYSDFSITAATHRYSHQYFRGSDGKDYYAWYIDGTFIASVLTNFSYSTSIPAGGEVGVDRVETMGNTLGYEHEKVARRSDGSYYRTAWGGHTNYGDDAPYTNVNGTNVNAFYSKDNE